MNWLWRDRSVATPGPVEKASVADVKLAYRLILKREVDAAGLAAYTQRITEGLTLDELVASLLASEERSARLAGKFVGDSAPASSSTLIDPKEVMRRYTVEELNETSDEYYRKMWDPAATLRKPFASVDEAPEMLENLGALIGGLHLGKAMTVLDFGAGTCWLSRLVAQLNCRMVCCDPSPAALAIGRKFFEEHPPLGHEILPVTFLEFDGHRLDLPDASIDRIICFDAFHHVPNPAEVLREFGRVLRDGGIAGFSEPGRYHSRSPQSQYEMKTYRVLENDVDLNEIFSLAASAGFSRLTVRLLNDLEVPLADYNSLLNPVSDDGALRVAAWDRMSETMMNRSVFFLHKGDLRRDSRGHAGLSHAMHVVPNEVMLPAQDDAVTLTFTITNTGEAYWLHEGPEIFGLVRLGCHLYDEAGALVTVDHFRHALSSTIAPGHTITVTVSVPVPAKRPCTLVFDLVAEGVRWFETGGSVPATVKVR